MQKKTFTANLLNSLGIDEFFTRTDGVGVRALLPDALGSTVALGDNTGTLQTQYTYEPFGVTTQTGVASSNSYKFTGREDDGTGLYYYRMRYYSPRLQRFTSEDPIGFYAGPNLYTYVNNKVTRFSDPWGLDPSQRSKFSLSVGATWGTNGLQCTLGGGCKPTTTFPPAFQVGGQVSYNQPPPHLNPVNVNVNIYNKPLPSNGSSPIAGFGGDISVGTYIYENPNPGPGGQTMLQQGVSVGLGLGVGPTVTISR